MWQIPSEQTSQERGAAWQPYCHHRNLLLSQMSPPLLQLLGHCSCIGTVVRGLPTSGTLCCSDEGNDAIRRPHSLSLHPPSAFPISFLVNGRKFSGVGKEKCPECGTAVEPLSIVVVVPIRLPPFHSSCSCASAQPGTSGRPT